jgi:hypothetical protein
MSFAITRLKYPFFFMFLIMRTSPLDAQVLNDPVSLNLVKTTVDQIYNMRFKDASETTKQLSKNHPDHPVIFLLRGMIIYWEGFPLMAGSEKSRDFEKQMRLCIEKSHDFEPENEPEFLLTNLCARGSMLAFYAGNDLPSKAFSLGRTTYRHLRHAFEFTNTFPDFLFFTGLYNYYREAYPEAHPAYRPLMRFFPRGDREKGMQELRTAFRKSIFLKAEASTFLSSNYKYFENDFTNASYFSKLIYEDFPGNIVYRINCIEDLLLIQKYEAAQKLISSTSTETGNRYYNAQIMILNAILAEKNNDLNRAEEDYRNGIKIISEFKKYGDQYSAYAYFGLSRISASRKDSHNQRVFRRRALDLTNFDHVNFN